MLRRAIAAMTSLSILVGSALPAGAGMNGNPGEFFYRYKDEVATTVTTPDPQSKDVVAFYIGGVDFPFSEILPLKPEWQDDDWRVVDGFSLPAGITFNKATRTFEGTPTEPTSGLSADMVGVDANGQTVATARVTFDIEVVQGVPVKADIYAHTGKYKLAELAIPAGMTVDYWVASKQLPPPPGVTNSGPYFEGAPTAKGNYNYRIYGQNYMHETIVTFWGTYIVEDGPTFPTVADNIVPLPSPKTSPAGYTFNFGPTPINHAISDPSKVLYQIVLDNGEVYPGTVKPNFKPLALNVYGQVKNPYETAKVKWKATDTDGTVGESNWFTFGTSDPTPECTSQQPYSALYFSTDQAYKRKIGNIYGPVDGTVSYALASGVFPDGLKLDTTTGEVIGTPKTAEPSRIVVVTVNQTTSTGQQLSAQCNYYVISTNGAFTIKDKTALQDMHVRVGKSYTGRMEVTGGIPNFDTAMAPPATLSASSVTPSPTRNENVLTVSGIPTAAGDIVIPFSSTNGDGNTATGAAKITAHGPLDIYDAPTIHIQRLAKSKTWHTFDYDIATVIPDVDDPVAQPKFVMNNAQALPLDIALASNGDLNGMTAAKEGTYGPLTVTMSDYSGDKDTTLDFNVVVDPREDIKVKTLTEPSFTVEMPGDQKVQPVTVEQPEGAANFKIEWTLNDVSGNGIPSWLHFDKDTGEMWVDANIDYSLINDYGKFSITATDSENSTVTSDEFDVHVTDWLPPSATVPAGAWKGSVNGNLAIGETQVSSINIANLASYVDVKNTIIGGASALKFVSIDPAAPAGLKFDAANGVIYGVPTAEYKGDITVTFEDGKKRQGTMVLPLEVRDYPTVKTDRPAFDLPRLSQAATVAPQIAGTMVNGFWNAPTWSVDTANGTDISAYGLAVNATNGNITGRTDAAENTVISNVVLKAVSVGANNERLVSRTAPFTINVVKPVPMTLEYKPDTATYYMRRNEDGSYTYDHRSAALPTVKGSNVPPLAYSFTNRAQLITDGFPSSMDIGTLNGEVTGIPGPLDKLGIWTAIVDVSDSEQRKAVQPYSLTIKSTLNGTPQYSERPKTIKLRLEEPFKIPAIDISNEIRPLIYSTNPAALPSTVAPGFESLTGAFNDAGYFDAITGAYQIAVNVKDAHDRKFTNPLVYTFNVVKPLQVSVPVAARSVVGKQYSAAQGGAIDAAFSPDPVFVLGKITYGISGDLPGTLVNKVFDVNDALVGYAWTIDRDGYEIEVNQAGIVTGYRVNGSPTALKGTSTDDYLPLDALVFDKFAATLKGIPSKTGVFTANLTAHDDHAEGYVRSVPSQKDYNNAVSEDITFTVSPADDMIVSNSAETETLSQYTTKPSIVTSVQNAAYGRPVTWTAVASNLPAGVQPAKGALSLSYTGYPTAKGTFSGNSWKLVDAAGRPASSTPVEFVVGDRQAFALKVPENPVVMIVNVSDADTTVTASNAAYGTTIPAKDWKVTGDAGLPPNVTYVIKDGGVVFSGISDVVGDYPGVTVSATDSVGAQASIALVFKVAEPSGDIDLKVSDITTKAGYPFQMQATATNTYGKVTFYSHDITGDLATQLSLDGSTGLVTGQFDQLGDRNFDVYVTDKTNRVTSKPVKVSVIPDLRITVPVNVAATQGSALNRTIDTAYFLGKVTYEKGSGNWPDGFAVNPNTGEITGYDMSSGSLVNRVTASVGTYPGLTIKAVDTFDINGVTYTDSQVSNAFAFTIAPTTAVPAISNVTGNKLILGTQGSQITAWTPAAVEKGTTKKWVYGEFTTNYDLAQYGLTLNKSTGTISGTPTAPFIIRDFVITVTSATGSAKTAAFWIGAAPSAAMQVASTQKKSYLLRLNKDFATDPIVVDNAIGNLTFSKPSAATTWNTTTGVWSNAATGQSATWVNKPATLTTNITDEFARTTSFSFDKDFVAALTLGYSTTTFVSNSPATSATPTVGGGRGTLSFALQNAPDYVSIDANTGAVTATLPTAAGQSFTASVTDSWDGWKATGTVSFTNMVPDIADVANKKLVLGTEGVAISPFVPTVSKPDGTVWNYPDTVYSLNYDLSQYGLSLNTKTGEISGTPTSAFIIRDAVMTVTSVDGKSDKTTAFWLGVAPSAPLQVDPAQKNYYLVRSNKGFTSDPVVVLNSIGNLTFTGTAVAVGFDSATGSYILTPANISWWDLYGTDRTVTTTAQDEFGRTVPFTMSYQVRRPFAFNYANKTMRMIPSATLPKPAPSAETFVGNVTWSAVGLPSPLVMAPSGVITGTVPAGSYPNGTTFTITMTAVDDGDPSPDGTLTKTWVLTLNN
ncbi:putative Ig domain-containing protein [Rhizobium sp. BK176]|uniref:putative Ig domain-containing protein n=1 Tax=Rhizobium sp. BK176 TaxID=2587071 RepID=UPI002169A651|nr:putative Ig domain-containing protein [Rhizobium sp. BK176]MCS4090125.1 hypothetical protein [Rhizobium sp. BK176]